MKSWPNNNSAKAFDAFIREKLWLAPSDVQLADPTSPVDESVRDRLRDLNEHVCAPITVFEKVWDHMLTPREKSRLGGRDRTAAFEMYRYAPTLLVCARPIWYPRAVLEIAVATQQLLEMECRTLRQTLAPVDPVSHYLVSKGQSLGIKETDVYPAIEDAIDIHRLVIVDSPGVHALYWDRERVKVPPSQPTKPWTFLATLVKAHLRNDFYRPSRFPGVDSHTINTWKSRLSEWLPMDFYKMIRFDRSAEGYKLVGLPSSQIKLFEDIGGLCGSHLPLPLDD